MAEIINVEQAVSLIKDGCRLGVGAFATSGAADALLRGMRRSFDATGSPNNITLICPTTAGDDKDDGWGLSAIGVDGIVSKIYTSRLGKAPSIARAGSQNKIAAYILPLGVFGHLFRAQAGGKPGIVTHIGKYTFADPRNEGCRMNPKAVEEGEEIVSLIEIDGKEYLFYRVLPMDVCIIRGSFADEAGNVSLENEVLPAEAAEMAEAVHNSGGTVIVQVGKLAKKGELDPTKVRIPSVLVDFIVVADPEDHPFSYADDTYQPQMLQQFRIPLASVPPMKMGVRKMVARRGAMELKKGMLVNLGLGISDGVSIVASEEGLSDDIALTVETGIFGGVPLAGPRMGMGVNADARLSLADTFDLYDGGVLDACFLSFAEVDKEGNVNVSKFGGRVVGPGGFVNISQNTNIINFMATFNAGKDMEFECDDGKLKIVKDGTISKFKEKVEQITFSGRYAIESGQQVRYITERAVFVLTDKGLMLSEIAPGVDLEKDVLAHMDFRPIIAEDLKLMDPRIFRDEKMGLQIGEMERKKI